MTAPHASTNLANGIELHHVRDTLGHSPLSTTSIYVNGEDDARHAAITPSQCMSWAAVGKALSGDNQSAAAD